ncbi:MAG: peptidylprolyl isomerase [Thermoanaerobaculia bacterium]|nr:peptidylprolyl isomerase [Thermoanaerobaculia bacterium]
MLRRFTLLLLILGVLLSACGREQEIPPEAVAVVGERMLTLEDFKRYLERNPATELVQLSPPAASALLDQYIEQVLLSEYAESQDLLVPADRIAEAVRNDPGSTVVEKRDELQRNRLLEQISLQTDSPSQDEIRRYYDENTSQFEMEERIRIRQILLRDQELAEEVRDSIVNGEATFEEMARDHSLAPNASKGGEVGEIARGDLPQIIEKEIFNLEEGAISPVVEAAGTFHLFKIEKRLPAGTLDLETVAPLISSRLRGDLISDRLVAETAEARSLIPVRVLTRRLPFEYTGNFPTAPDE